MNTGNIDTDIWFDMFSSYLASYLVYQHRDKCCKTDTPADEGTQIMMSHQAVLEQNGPYPANT